MIYKKYLLPFEPDIDYATVKVVGKEITQKAVYEDGELVSPAEYGDRWRVDVIWFDKEEDWDEYLVEPETHDHWFLGMEYLWHESK